MEIHSVVGEKYVLIMADKESLFCCPPTHICVCVSVKMVIEVPHYSLTFSIR